VPDPTTITVVSGLPRSGTSLMMRMLAAGGMPVLTDHVRAADEDNRQGYYEYEPVKQLPRDPTVLNAARGKVVKIISELLRHIPPTYPCKVIFMQRAMAEVLASQQQMLIRRGKPTDAISDADMAALFTRHLHQIERWIDQQAHLDVCKISYNELMREPAPHIMQINTFLGGTLDTPRMARVIDPTLYRQRAE
jgi:hypothetical protein